MKWLSLKEYIPPACTYLFIRAICPNEDKCGLYDRYFVGSIEDLNFATSLEYWTPANSDTFGEFYPKGYEVTHFCIPDAVKKEISAQLKNNEGNAYKAHELPMHPAGNTMFSNCGQKEPSWFNVESSCDNFKITANAGAPDAWERLIKERDSKK